MSDHYEVLGVARNATDDQIKKAYRRLARELHPDVNDAPESQEKFKLVTHAYEVLSDPDERRKYDMGGQDPFGGMGGFGNFFDSFFGGGQARGPASRVQRGQDALIRVEMTLDEVVFGAAKSIAIETAVLCEECNGTCCRPGTSPSVCDVCGGAGSIQYQARSLIGNILTTKSCQSCGGFGQRIDSCNKCAGHGRVRARRTLDLDIPAGVEDGMRLQLSGQGEVGPAGGPQGDIYVDIAVRAHEIFSRNGDELHCTLEVPVQDAVLGNLATIETFDGPINIQIENGSQSGDQIYIKNKGVKHFRGSGRGDLYVTIQVKTPGKTDPKQKELFRQLAELRKSDEIKLAKHTQGQYSKRKNK
jgi:molecular chaperone DnaJ